MLQKLAQHCKRYSGLGVTYLFVMVIGMQFTNVSASYKLKNYFYIVKVHQDAGFKKEVADAVCACRCLRLLMLRPNLLKDLSR